MKTTASKPSSTPYFRVGKLTTGSWRSFSAAKGPGAVKALGLARLQPSSLVSLQGTKVYADENGGISYEDLSGCKRGQWTTPL